MKANLFGERFEVFQSDAANFRTFFEEYIQKKRSRDELRKEIKGEPPRSEKRTSLQSRIEKIDSEVNELKSTAHLLLMKNNTFGFCCALHKERTDLETAKTKAGTSSYKEYASIWMRDNPLEKRDPTYEEAINAERNENRLQRSRIFKVLKDIEVRDAEIKDETESIGEFCRNAIADLVRSPDTRNGSLVVVGTVNDRLRWFTELFQELNATFQDFVPSYITRLGLHLTNKELVENIFEDVARHVAFAPPESHKPLPREQLAGLFNLVSKRDPEGRFPMSMGYFNQILLALDTGLRITEAEFLGMWNHEELIFDEHLCILDYGRLISKTKVDYLFPASFLTILMLSNRTLDCSQFRPLEGLLSSKSGLRRMDGQSDSYPRRMRTSTLTALFSDSSLETNPERHKPTKQHIIRMAGHKTEKLLDERYGKLAGTYGWNRRDPSLDAPYYIEHPSNKDRYGMPEFFRDENGVKIDFLKHQTSWSAFLFKEWHKYWMRHYSTLPDGKELISEMNEAILKTQKKWMTVHLNVQFANQNTGEKTFSARVEEYLGSIETNIKRLSTLNEGLEDSKFRSDSFELANQFVQDFCDERGISMSYARGLYVARKLANCMNVWKRIPNPEAIAIKIIEIDVSRPIGLNEV